jgi:hypothetical protein
MIQAVHGRYEPAFYGAARCRVNNLTRHLDFRTIPQVARANPIR